MSARQTRETEKGDAGARSTARARGAEPGATARPLAALQQAAGNQAMAALLRSRLQPARVQRDVGPKPPASTLDLEHHLDASDKQRIDSFLGDRGFGAPPGGGLAIDGHPATADEIADLVMSKVFGPVVIGTT